MCYYVYADHAQYTIKTYAKMALFRLVLTGVLSVLDLGSGLFMYTHWSRSITTARIHRACATLAIV